MSQQRAIQPLTQGALLAALTALLGIVSLGFPPLRFVTDFLWGIPVIIVITKHNARLGMMVLGVSLLLLLLFFNPISVLLFAVRMSPLAIGYGLLIKRGISPGKSLLIGTLIAVVSEVLAILGFLYIAGISIIPAQEEMRSLINEAINVYKQAGILDIYAKQGITEDMVKDLFYQFIYLYTLLIPAGLVLSSIIRAFLTWIISQRVMKRVGFDVQSLPRFSQWALPWYWIWFLIVGLVVTMAGDQYGFENVSMVGKNIVAVVLFIYLVIGLAIGISFIKNWNLPTWLKVLMVIIAFLNLSGTMIMLMMLGIFDSFVVFRRFSQAEE